MHRYFWLVCLTGLLHCGPVEEEGPPPEPPEVDRESWGAELELYQPGLVVEIECAHLCDDLERGISRGDGGVRMAFVETGIRSRIWADRMVLDREREVCALGGGIRIEAGDSLEVQSDTLVWRGKSRRIEIPGQVRVASSEGWEKGRRLHAGYDFGFWAMEEVAGRWKGGRGEEEYEVEIRALRETGRREGGRFTLSYDSVEVSSGGISLRGARAAFRQAEGQVRFWGGAAGADSARRLEADRMEFDLGKRTLRAYGGISLRDSGWTLSAARLEEDRRAGRLFCTGEPVVFEGGGRRIEAPFLEYREAEDRLTGKGGVRFVEDGRRMRMERLEYDRAGERFHAEGEVRIEAPEFGGTLFGGRLFYDLSAETGRLEGDPLLRKRTAGGEDLTVRTRTVRFDLSRRRMGCPEGFELRWKGLNLEAERGIYEAAEDRFLAGGGAELEQRAEKGESASRVQADSMVVLLGETGVRQVDLPGGMRITVDSRGDRRIRVDGKEGKVVLNGRRMERIALEDSAEVVCGEKGGKETSRFRGGKMILWFGDGGLDRVWIGGGAELTARMSGKKKQKSGVNRARGKEMEIFFEEGEIVRVEMGPGIEGSFYLPEEKE